MSQTPTQPRQLICSELAPFNVADGELLCAVRCAGHVYAGVRVGGAGSDRHSWIYGRYGEHKDAAYEGFWAMHDAPLGGGARGLRIEGAVKSGPPDAPLWTARQGATLSFGWNTDAQSGAFGPSGAFEIRVWNAQTGVEAGGANPATVSAQTEEERAARMEAAGANPATVSAQTASAGGKPSELSRALPALEAGSYTVWIRFAAPNVYRGLPPDFEAVSGQKPGDKALQWTDARTGRVYAFSPRFGVGALPPLGQPLRDEFETLLASGGVRKRPEWTGWLFEMDAGGQGVLGQTEWAMVRLVVQDARGVGAWIGERQVHAGACPGAALLRLDGSAQGNPGALVPHSLRASLRSVGALQEIDGALFIGAMEAGENGRYASIIEAAPEGGDDPRAALGQVSVEQRWCECALLNETVHALARFPDRPDGRIYGASSCELFERRDDLPPGQRLVGSDPGGRSLVVGRPQSGRAFMGRAVESDFSGSDRFWPSHAYLVVQTALGQSTGPGVSALYNSVLWTWNGRVWGITDADPDLWEEALRTGSDATRTLALTFQSLCWFDGALWHKVARWPRSRYYLSRGGACGERMLLFGRRQSDRRPIAFRFDGQKLESNIELPFYVERADTTLSEDGTRQTLLLSCVKADPQATDNTVLPGFFLVETEGELDTRTLVFPCTHDDAKGQCDRWCLPRGLVESVVGDLSNLTGCSEWTGVCWKRGDCEEIRKRGVWLEIEVSEELVCFVRHGGPMPYDTGVFDGLRWTQGQDCIDPENRCGDARCAWNVMPEGTRVYVARFSGAEDALAAPLLRFAVTDGMTNDGIEMCSFWPCLWARADAPTPFPIETAFVPNEAMLEQMAQFKTRVLYGTPVSLPKPAQKWLDVLVFIPPGYKWDTVIQPL